MTTNQCEEKYLDYLYKFIPKIEETTHKFIQKLSPPIYIDEKGKERFRFINPDSRHYQVCKSIRIATSLYSAHLLLKTGLVQDVGNVFRTIHDCLTEIDFVQEAQETQAPTTGQKKIIDLFFNRELQTMEEMKNTPPKYDKVGRKEIRASLGRRLESQMMNRNEIQSAYQLIDNMWSGYTHAEYLETMELFEIFDDVMICRIRGVWGTPKISVFRYYLASFIMNTLNRFCLVAKNLGLEELASELLEMRIALEQSDAHKDRSCFE